MNCDPLPDIREISQWVCVYHSPDPVYRFTINWGREVEWVTSLTGVLAFHFDSKLLSHPRMCT